MNAHLAPIKYRIHWMPTIQVGHFQPPRLCARSKDFLMATEIPYPAIKPWGSVAPVLPAVLTAAPPACGNPYLAAGLSYRFPAILARSRYIGGTAYPEKERTSTVKIKNYEYFHVYLSEAGRRAATGFSRNQFFTTKSGRLPVQRFSETQAKENRRDVPHGAPCNEYTTPSTSSPVPEKRRRQLK